MLQKLFVYKHLQTDVNENKSVSTE